MVNVEFYKSHGMPKLSTADGENKELTIEHRGFMNHAITIINDNIEATKLLKEIGWIRPNPIVSVDNNGNQIDYYELTRKALDFIEEKATEQNKKYPK